MRKLVPFVFVAVLAACARPSDGPTAGSFYSATDPQTNERIRVVRLADAPMDPLAVSPLAYSAADNGLSIMRSGGFADTRLRRGDVIEVRLIATDGKTTFDRRVLIPVLDNAPRNAGVLSTTTLLFGPLRPRPFKVSRCFGMRPAPLRI